MAGAATERTAAELALQEFIDALQALILLLPSSQRLLERSLDSPQDATSLALQRTIITAKRLRERLPQLTRESKAWQP
jgi:hypothetical protein